MDLDTLISIGYWVSTIGFFVATIAMGVAVSRFGKSTLGTIFSYVFIGTAIFLFITIFQALGGDYFGISNSSMDVWWHLMFYLAFITWFQGLRLLTKLGTSDAQVVVIGSEKMWGVIVAVILAVIFVTPKSADGFAIAYLNSSLGMFGLHHFLAFGLAGLVAAYLMKAKKNLGQIGKAIANPMIITMWAFGLQHFWELLNESWKVVHVTSQVGEGGEKIFLTIAAIGITYAAWRLNSFAKQLVA